MGKSSLKVVGAALVFGSVAVAGLAQARNATSIIGRPGSPSDLGCFTHSWFQVSNTCTSTKEYNLPLPIDSSGTKSVTVSVSLDWQHGSFTCQSFGLDKNSTTYWNSALVYANGGPAVLTLQSGGFDYYDLPMSVYVPGSGNLSVQCFVPQSGRILTTQWSP